MRSSTMWREPPDEAGLPRRALGDLVHRAIGRRQFGAQTTLTDRQGLNEVLRFDRDNGEIEGGNRCWP